MRKWHLAAALTAVAGIPVISAGCEPAPLGELVLIVKTDMAPPKDFNKLRIEVFNEGQLKFQFEGPVPGDPNEEQRIVLPSTLGLVAPEDPTNSIRIEVGVRSGGKDGPVRVVREVVTTIPADRVAMLHVPIQFLCKNDDIPFNSDGNLESECGKDKTCIAGVCEDSKVDSATLPDYDPDAVYGGSGDPTKGTCFDVGKCFETAELIDAETFDVDNCTFPVPKIGAKALNLALGVESDGICNGRGCFVVLDANSDTGWKLDDAKANVLLPKGVCANLGSGKGSGLKVLQIVQAKTNADCPQKDETYPTCGPWSAVESAEPDKPSPVSVAGAQDHPISVALLSNANGDFAYWTSGGAPGSIRGVSTNGGSVVAIPSTEPPRDLVLTDKAIFWTASKSAVDGGLGSVYAFLDPEQNDEPLKQLATGLAQPDGIATFGNKLFWTSFANAPTGTIYMGTLNGALTAFTNGVQELSTGNAYPARIVADSTYVYWTNEGTFQEANGSVGRIQHAVAGPTKLVLTPDPMAAPRALTLDAGDGSGESTLYFATIADGKVWRIPNASAATPGAPELFADGLGNPNGIAVDDKNVYVTDRKTGSILYKPKDADPALKATVIATGQKNPGTIVIRGGFLFWVNEGPSASDTKEGSIVKLDTSKL